MRMFRPFLFWILFCATGINTLLQIPGNTIASPTWKLIRTRTWPQSVGLGESFYCQVVVRMPSQTRLASPLPQRWGTAHLVSPPHIQSVSATSQTMRIDFVLAFYDIPAFGLQTLPPLVLTLQSPQGYEQEITLPGIQIEAMQRYAHTQRFQSPHDPQPPPIRPNTPLPTTTPPPVFSHEWQSIAATLDSTRRSAVSFWSSPWILGSVLGAILCLLLGLGYWWKQRHRWIGKDPLPHPYAWVLQQLKTLRVPSSHHPAAYQAYYQQGLHILRTYFTQRLKTPMLHLTEREFAKTLRANMPVAMAMQEPWWQQLQVILQECEQNGYHPYPARVSSSFVPQLRSVLELFETQLTLQEQQEQQERSATETSG